MLTNAGCSGYQPPTRDPHRPTVLAQHNRRQWSGEDPSWNRWWDGAWPGQQWTALCRPPLAPRAEQLAISRTTPALQRGSKYLLRTEHALQSSDSPLDMLVQRAPPQALTMISQRFNRLRKQS